MKPKKKLKVGVIGLGRIAPRHIDDSIEQLDELELAAVCDVVKKVADKVASEKHVKAYYDYKKLIDDPEIDLVAITTPNKFHYEIAAYAAKKNKDVILEKPIGQNFSQAKKLVELFDKSDATLFPVLQVRYNPAIQIVKDVLKKKALGKILSASVIIRWTRPQEYFDESSWKGTKDIDGGSLLTQAIHYVDITQYLLGDIKSVFAKVGTKKLKIENEDYANAILEFGNGITTNFEFTIYTYPHNLESSITILGEKGTIKIGGLAMNEIEIWEVENMPEPTVPESLTPNNYAGGMYVGSCPNHKSIYENVVNTLVYGKKSQLPGKEALPSLKIIDLIKESAKSKKEIKA